MSGDFSLVEQYQISSPSAGGSLLTLSGASPGQYVTLEAGRNDDSQLWTLWASALTSGYRVESYKSNIAYVAELPGNAELLGVSADNTIDWYMFTTDTAEHYKICQDPGCYRAWAPYSQVGGPSGGNQIGLVPPTDAEYAIWKIVPVGSSSPPGGVSSSVDPPPAVSTTTSAAFSVIPDGTVTSLSIPVVTEESALSKQNLEVVKKCCGKPCEFTPSGDATSQVYKVLIGQPVANCDASSKENTMAKFGGSFELQHSFSYEVTSSGGLGFAGPSIGVSTTVGEQRTTKTTETQEIEVPIPPGKMGALVAHVSYSTQPGRMSVDHRTLAFVSIQPENVVAIHVVYASCQSSFDALSLPRAPDCLNSGMRRSQARSESRRILVWLVIFVVSFWAWI